jgi:hypothetical protein
MPEPSEQYTADLQALDARHGASLSRLKMVELGLLHLAATVRDAEETIARAEGVLPPRP